MAQRTLPGISVLQATYSPSGWASKGLHRTVDLVSTYAIFSSIFPLPLTNFGRSTYNEGLLPPDPGEQHILIHAPGCIPHRVCVKSDGTLKISAVRVLNAVDKYLEAVAHCTDADSVTLHTALASS